MYIDKRILSNLLPGLIPLFIFILVEKYFGTVPGLLAALGLGMAGFIIGYITTGRIERFILLDIAFLLLLGSISLLSGNELFFKLKPAVIELVFAAILGLSGYTRRNFIFEMSRRYLRDTQITAAAGYRMTRSIRVVFWLTIGHAALVVYAAFAMNSAAWAFISGVLFYLLLAVYFLFELIRARILRDKLRKTEFLPHVDEKGRVLGKVPRHDAHFNPSGKFLHPVVHLHVFDEKGRLFLQHRPLWKEIQPGKWDTAVGGHLSYGDTIESGLRREAYEELRILPENPVFIKSYLWETEAEKELVYMFYTFSKEEPQFNPEELSDGRFWEMDEIEKSLNEGLFTTNFIYEFSMLREFTLKHQG